MAESSGPRKYSTLLVIRLFSRRLCLCHCLCICLCICICQVVDSVQIGRSWKSILNWGAEWKSERVCSPRLPSFISSMLLIKIRNHKMSLSDFSQTHVPAFSKWIFKSISCHWFNWGAIISVGKFQMSSSFFFSAGTVPALRLETVCKLAK